MYTVIVNLQVKPDMVERFVEAVGENSRASRHDEPGCLRFDVRRGGADPNRFFLYELYTDERPSRRTRRPRTSRSGGRSAEQLTRRPGQHLRHPVSSATCPRPAGDQPVDGPAPGGDRALRPRQRRRHHPVRRQVELRGQQGHHRDDRVLAGHRHPAALAQRRGERPRLRGRGHRRRRGRRVRPGRRPGHLGAGRRPALLPQPRRGLDDHLLGLRRPRRHPHDHRHRRDVRAPVGERPRRRPGARERRSLRRSTRRRGSGSPSTRRSPTPTSTPPSTGRPPRRPAGPPSFAERRRPPPRGRGPAGQAEDSRCWSPGRWASRWPRPAPRWRSAPRRATTTPSTPASSSPTSRWPPPPTAAGSATSRSAWCWPSCRGTSRSGRCSGSPPRRSWPATPPCSSTRRTPPAARWRCRACSPRPGAPRGCSPPWWSPSRTSRRSPGGYRGPPGRRGHHHRQRAGRAGGRAGRGRAPSRSRCSSSAAPTRSSSSPTPTCRGRRGMAARGRFLNAGQSCISPKRFVVDASVAEEFTRLSSPRWSALAVGDPRRPAPTSGRWPGRTCSRGCTGRSRRRSRPAPGCSPAGGGWRARATSTPRPCWPTSRPGSRPTTRRSSGRSRR